MSATRLKFEFAFSAQNVTAPPRKKVSRWRGYRFGYRNRAASALPEARGFRFKAHPARLYEISKPGLQERRDVLFTIHVDGGRMVSLE
ncbi:MAG: hypothetical protein WAK01_07380, partial [Methylocystis sp.]